MSTDTLGQRVRRLRIMRGWSVRALAERAELSSSYVSRLENGHVNPKALDLERIARALGVTQAELRGEDEEILVRRVAELESDPETLGFLVGAASRLSGLSTAEERRFLLRALNALLRLDLDTPEQGESGARNRPFDRTRETFGPA